MQLKLKNEANITKELSALQKLQPLEVFSLHLLQSLSIPFCFARNQPKRSKISLEWNKMPRTEQNANQKVFGLKRSKLAN